MKILQQRRCCREKQLIHSYLTLPGPERVAKSVTLVLAEDCKNLS